MSTPPGPPSLLPMPSSLPTIGLGVLWEWVRDGNLCCELQESGAVSLLFFFLQKSLISPLPPAPPGKGGGGCGQ